MYISAGTFFNMLTHPGISQVLRHTCYNLSAQNTLICPADIQLSCSLKRTEPWYVCFLVLHPISAYFNVKTKLLASFHLRFWHSASQHIVRDVLWERGFFLFYSILITVRNTVEKMVLSNYICMFISSRNIPSIFTFLFFLPAFSQEKVIHALHASTEWGKT